MTRVFCVDFDGVIADTGLAKSRWLSSNAGFDVEASVSDRTSLEAVVGPSIYRQMQSSVGFEDTLDAAPIAGALVALEEIAGLMPIYVLTSRSQKKAEWVEQWIAKFGLESLIEGTLSCVERSKSSVAMSLNASFIVDNDVRHLLELPRSIFGLHFGPEDRGKHNLHRARTWSEVLGFIRAN